MTCQRGEQTSHLETAYDLQEARQIETLTSCTPLRKVVADRVGALDRAFTEDHVDVNRDSQSKDLKDELAG